MFGSDDFDAKNQDVYLRWCIEIVANVLFCLLCARQSCITRHETHRSNKVFNFSLKGHEIVHLAEHFVSICFVS